MVGLKGHVHWIWPDGLSKIKLYLRSILRDTRPVKGGFPKCNFLPLFLELIIAYLIWNAIQYIELYLTTCNKLESHIKAFLTLPASIDHMPCGIEVLDCWIQEEVTIFMVKRIFRRFKMCKFAILWPQIHLDLYTLMRY